MTQEILNIAQIKPPNDEFDDLVKRVGLRRALRRALRVGVLIKRFVHNCRNKTKKFGPITAEEVKMERIWWIKRIQERDRQESVGTNEHLMNEHKIHQKSHYPKTEAELDLRLNEENLTVCHGRIQGEHPIYLPRNAMFTEKLVEEIHCNTLHGGEWG